jgi:hypothetical protein
MTEDLRDYFSNLGAAIGGPVHPEEETKAVTVRLGLRTISELDVLAHYAGFPSRQALLNKIILGGLRTAEVGFLDGCDEKTHQDYHDALGTLLEQEGLSL